MRSINQVFTRNLRNILFKDTGNKKRKEMIKSLIKKDKTKIEKLWNFSLRNRTVKKKYKINQSHCFKISTLPMGNGFYIITLYIPYAMFPKDYVLISFINTDPERMCFCGIELSKETITREYVKTSNIVNCFCFWRDPFFHFKTDTISNEFLIFDIYMDLYSDYVRKKDKYYIPVKKDVDSLSYFFINTESAAIETNAKNYQIEKNDFEALIFNIFHLSIQLALKNDEKRLTPGIVSKYTYFIINNKKWLSHSSKAFYGPRIIRKMMELQNLEDLCRFCCFLLTDYKYKNNFCFLDLESRRYCFYS